MEQLTSSPLSYVMDTHNLRWAAAIIAVGSVTTLTATILVSLVGQPRIFYQMSQDGLLFKPFSRVNSKQVPSFGIILSGAFSAVLATFLSLAELVDMISIGTLLAFTVVCGGTIILRASGSSYREKKAAFPLSGIRYFSPNALPWALVVHFCGSALISYFIKFSFPLWAILLSTAPSLLSYGYVQICYAYLHYYKAFNCPDTFQCPLVPLVPYLGMFTNIYLICQLEEAAIYRVIIWTFCGILIYAFYGIRNSKLNSPPLLSKKDGEITPEDP
jgi:APA family basic amino acid/polyamine antiporter